ncbi:MAG: DEAD/DEAH box helicase family protein [Paludibacteraceae bacterium]|nr:DEAD/DEAH box helicase family protein [Paludibacteraceae bacterium]
MFSDAPFAFSVPQEVIDDLLRFGSNTDNSRMRIAAEFSKDKPVVAKVGFITTEYHGGYGLNTPDGKYSAWYAEDGIHISRGETARYAKGAQIIPWADAVARIDALLLSGDFASNVELEEAGLHERKEIAETLWFLYRDFSEEAEQAGYLTSLQNIRGGGFPDETERLAQALADTSFRADLLREYQTFFEAYQADQDLLRFHYHQPDALLERLRDLDLPRRVYSTDRAELPSVSPFITEDEINQSLSGGSGMAGGRTRIYDYFQGTHTPKEKEKFLKDEYGTGGRSHALSNATGSSEDHGSKGIKFKKSGCYDVELRWSQVVKRIDALIAQNRYLPAAERDRYEVSEQAASTELDQVKETINEYSHAEFDHDADFSDLHRVDLGFSTTQEGERPIQVTADLLDYRLIYEVDGQTVATIQCADLDDLHGMLASLSFSEQIAIAEGNWLKQRTAEPEPAPTLPRKLTQDDIDQQLRTMFPDIETKRAVVRYMNEHGREKETAAWLAQQYYGTDVSQPLHIGFAGREGQPGDEVVLPWPKVQRRIAQLIKADNFYTQEEYDNLDDVDPIAIREHLAQAGIVNGEVVDPEALNRDPFIQQVMADAERIAQEEQEQSSPSQAASEPPKRPGQTRVERNYRNFARQFPEIVSGEYRYLELRGAENSGYMPLIVQSIGDNEIAISHTFTQDGDLMYDPEMTFRIDTEKGTLEPLTFRQDGSIALYQKVYPEPGKWIPRLRNELSAFTDQWLKNIEEQGRTRYRAIAVRDGEDVVLTFNAEGQPVPELPDGESGRSPRWSEYQTVKNAYPDSIVLYQVGDFFEMYGEDAQTAAELLGLDLGTRPIVGSGRIEFCGVPENRLEQTIETLRDTHDVAVSSINDASGMRTTRAYLSIDHEAEQAIDAHEREFGADGSRVFRDTEPEQYKTPGGIIYQVGDDVDSTAADGTVVRIHIDRIDDDYIWYTFPDMPEQEPVNIYRVHFEDHLDDGRDRIVRSEPVLTADEGASEPATDTPTQEPEIPDSEDYTPYHVGDMVYLDGTEFRIETIRDFSVELLDPTLLYPIFRAENKSTFEQLLRRDDRNSYITDFLPAELDLTDSDLQDVLVGDGGLLENGDKAQISAYFFNGEDNPRIARRMANTYAGVSNTMSLIGGEEADYFASENGLQIELQDKYSTKLFFSWDEIVPILRAMYQQERDGFTHDPNELAGYVPNQNTPEETEEIIPATEPVAESRPTATIYPAIQNGLPYDIVIQTIPTPEPELAQEAEAPVPTAENFRITDDHLGEGGPKVKFRRNMDAINLLHELEFEGRSATPEEQEVLFRYVGWGGLADAFDERKQGWSDEFRELYATLSPEEYAAARASTLNAHYTSPTVIKAMYEAIGSMGFQSGNILEPSMGVGNFFGLLPEEMSESRLFGVELDSITGRIAKQLYPNADITVAGFETTDRRDFFDLAVGNVPFGNYQVNDPAYRKLGFSIHNYFFAKTLDQVRPGGVIAFVTSRYTMDSKDPQARRYIAERADLLGAIRLPNNAFKANAGTEVVSDIIFLQKRDHPIKEEPDWVHLGENKDGFSINSYFVEHPDMILGRESSESTQYAGQDFTVEPLEGARLEDLLAGAIQNIRGTYTEAELPELGEGEEIDTSIPADPDVRNFSYTVKDGEVYYRNNSRMVKPELNATAIERVKGMVAMRDCVQHLIAEQMDGFTSDATIQASQRELNQLYDSFTEKFGLINSRGNALAFSDDSSYYLLCSLEELDEDRQLKRKADMFTKRTIKPHQVVTSVDTPAEALALSISERARVDMAYMSQLCGKTEEEIANELRGVIFRLPEPVDRDGKPRYVTADEYLSGNVRQKLRRAERAAQDFPDYFTANVEALRAAQPRDLDASEIEVRLGATWIDKEYIQQFMEETFHVPYYLQSRIEVNYSEFTAEWNISGKNACSYSDINAYVTYGTQRANAFKILEDTLNLRDVRIYDTVTDPDGKERRVLNSKETTLAQQKQQAIKDAFQDWVWRDPDRRAALVQRYNELFNSTRPREYDGRHITFSGMNPEITLREHQLNAVAHILYGGNTLLAHEVGAGKTYEMVAAAMESKRLGLCQKSLFVVPNHLIEQWSSEFLRLYPSANILVATKKDFEPQNRKKFCARIATGEYDAVIIGHSQFERIPVSLERQENLLEEQIGEIEDGIAELKASRAENFTIKQMERTKKQLETKLQKLLDGKKKDDVITFEQLGVDRLYVDEAHGYKNLFLYTKMRNVAGLSTTDAQKSSDMFLKCRYIDEITDSKGIVFATGTPVSNSMTELYTMMRYLQHDTIRRQGLAHFDCWASTFGETTTAIELAPEGTGYRARTRFAKFFNLPELMNLFKEAADIKTSDQLNLPTPTPIYHNVVAQPTEIQREMVQQLSERAAEVHTGKIDPSVDNMLKITSDGRKLGLDQRVINPNLPDDPTSKVNMCVDNVFRIWEDGKDQKLTQLLFCDLSTPKARATQGKKAAKASGTINGTELHALEAMLDKEITEEPEQQFTIYDDIRDKLIARGVPAEQIAYIHDANTEVRKKELFAKVRSGQVRVLMGSTFKMGAGMNVQDRLIALHDLDCPWRPGDLEQRSGRIIRQGNQNPEVHIYRYVTESTFDAYLWQTVENKQKFISQIMTSKSPVRSCEDIDETALSYAEIKALCAGDERIKEKMDLDIDVARLKLMKANHQSQQYRLEDNLLKGFPAQIEQYKSFIEGIQKDMQTLAAHPHPEEGFAGMTVRGDHLTDKENAGAALLDAMKDAKGMEPVPVGSYRGFEMSLSLENFGKDYILTLKGEMSHRATLGKDARGNLTRIDNSLNGMQSRLDAAKAKLDNAYAQMETAKAELGKPFPQEEELRTKAARLAELNIELNIDDRTPLEAMAESTVAKKRPSVLEKLHAAKEFTQSQPTDGSRSKTKSQDQER